MQHHMFSVVTLKLFIFFMMLPSLLISGNDNVFIAMEQLISEWDPNGALTSMTWCTCGGMGSYTDPNGHITSFSRDLEGRVTGKTMPDGTSFALAYDTVTSRLLTTTDPNGSVTTNTYNDDDSIQQIAYTPEQGSLPPQRKRSSMIRLIPASAR